MFDTQHKIYIYELINFTKACTYLNSFFTLYINIYIKLYVDSLVVYDHSDKSPIMIIDHNMMHPDVCECIICNCLCLMFVY